MTVTKAGSRRIEFKTRTDEQKMLFEQKKDESCFRKTLNKTVDSLNQVDKNYDSATIMTCVKCFLPMSGMFDFPSLSAINTIRAGLNLMLSVAIIVAVGASFIMIGFELTKETATTTWFDCGDGGRVSVNTLEDGEDNCNNGADEAEGIRNQYIQEETGLLSLIFHGLGILVLVAGSLGLLTKVIADGVSAAINLNKHGLVDERQTSIEE